MQYVPVPNIAQVELFQIWDNQLCENVLHFEPAIALTPTLMTEIGGALVTWWNANIKAWVPSTLSLTGVKVTDLTTQFAPVVNISAGLPIVGTNVSPSLPNNCALVLTKRTLLRGRSFRGRVYQPGMIEGQVTNSAVSSAYVTNFLNAYNSIKTVATATTTWDMVVVSRKQAGAWLSVGEAHPVTGFTSDGNIDSQRRRLPGRGA